MTRAHSGITLLALGRGLGSFSVDAHTGRSAVCCCPQYPLHVVVVRSRHLGGEGLPRAAYVHIQTRALLDSGDDLRT